MHDSTVYILFVDCVLKLDYMEFSWYDIFMFCVLQNE